MPSEIYLPKSKAQYFPLTGKTYQKFPSGLVRVDQTFACAIDQVQSVRGLFSRGRIFPRAIVASPPERLRQYLTGEPDFYIFPDAKEVYDTPGFCKFVVSGYRYDQSSELFFTRNIQLVDISKSYTQSIQIVVGEPPVVYNWTIFERWEVESVTYHGVTGRTAATIAVGNFLTLSKRLLTRRLAGGLPPRDPEVQSSAPSTAIVVNWIPTVVSVTRRNFGNFDEYDATETLVPYY